MRKRVPPFAVPIAVGLAYYAGALIGMHLLRLPEATPSVVWPPNAILAASLLFIPRRQWWLALLGALVAHLAAELGTFPAPFVWIVFLTNAAEALVAVTFLQRFSDAPARFDTLRRLAIFLAGGAFLAPLLASFPDAAAVAAFENEGFWAVWRNRILSGVLGEIAIVPAVAGLMHLQLATLRRWSTLKRVETAAMTVGFAVLAAMPSTHVLPEGIGRLSLVLLLPFQFWAAVRFGVAGSALSLLGIVVAVVSTAVHGTVLFSSWPPDERAAVLQVFLIMLAVPMMCVAALVDERRRVAQELADRLRFEQTLSSVSGAFVHPASHETDSTFAGALHHLRETIEVYGAVLCAVTPDGRDQLVADDWADGAGAPGQLHIPRDLPWIWSRLRDGRTLTLADLHDVPADARRDRESFLAHGIRGAMVVPFVSSDSLIGALMVVTTIDGRMWTETLRDRIELAAHVLGNALARKRLEDALRASDNMKSAILGSLASHVAVVDREGRIIGTNESWTRFAKDNGGPAHPNVWAGVSYVDVCRTAAAEHAPGAVEALHGLEAVLDGSSPSFALEYSCHGEDRDRWFLMSVVPLRWKEGGAVVTHTETTERRRAELEVRQIRGKLAQLTRAGVVGELTASLAHQLSQPLTGIMSNAQAGRRMIASVPADLAELDDIFSDIIHDNTRAADVIRHLREMLRKAPPLAEPMDVNDIVRDAGKLVMNDAIIRNVSLQLLLTPFPPVIEGDRVQLQQAVLNLLLNAVEAVDDGNRGRRQVVVTTGSREPHVVEVCVTDSGPGLGLPAGCEHLVFEPFYTTKSSGLGLGLSIARSIAEAHGGHLDADGPEGAGATFRLTLPVRGPRA